MIRAGLGADRRTVRQGAGAAAVIVARAHPGRKGAVARLLGHGLGSLPWPDQRDRLLALGRIASHSSLALFLRYAQSRNGFLREAAILGLGAVRDRAGLSPVLAGLRSPIAAVRLAAIRAMQRISPKAAAPILRRLSAQDPSPAVRRAAAAALSSSMH